MRRKTPNMCKARKNNIKCMNLLQSPRYLGNKKDEADTKTADCSKVGQIIGNNKQQTYHTDQHLDLKEKDLYPGVSSQKRVIIRAEQ
eukprot:191262-Heterocapsa_arctica.AAC.1